MDSHIAAQSDDLLPLSISPRRIKLALAALVTALSLASVGVHILRFTADAGVVRWYGILFDLNHESNIPSYYQGATLMLSAILLLLIGRSARIAGRPDVLAWKLLGIIFVFLSIDEICSIHELIGYAIQKSKHYHGLLYFAWVIPGGVFAMLVGLCYTRFLLHLPRRVAILFLISGAIYVGGAVGMEMAGGAYSERFGEDNLPYQFLGDIEETMEMIGIGIFIATLLRYAAVHAPLQSFRVGEKTEPAGKAHRDRTLPHPALAAKVQHSRAG